MTTSQKITTLLLATLLTSCGGGGGGGDTGTPGGPPPATGPSLYFAANDGVSGDELWKTDGTEAGTVLIKDINLKGGSLTPRYNNGFTVFNGALYFAADDGVSGTELWKTDGTEAGTVRVKDISPGAVGSYPGYFTVFNGALYFFAYGSAYIGGELWKTDGTEAGTVRIKEISFCGKYDVNPNSIRFTVFNGVLYFSACDFLWRSDGTEAGTFYFKNLATQDFTVFNGKLYFCTINSVNKLWKTDGTAAGTVVVKDFAPIIDSCADLTVFNDALYFRANDGVSGTELWKSDGTEAGTVLVKDIYPGRISVAFSSFPWSLTVFNGALYFIAHDHYPGNNALWKTDGTEAGTVRVKDIDLGYGKFVVFNGALYFHADDGVSGIELWKTDGTEIGTVRVKDINLGVNSSYPKEFTVFNGALYFSAGEGPPIPDGYGGFVNNNELWKTDGTEAGTVRVKDINSGSLGSFPRGFTVFP